MIAKQEIANLSSECSGSPAGAGTLGIEVLSRLRGDILNCVLKPGERLRFEALKARYRVSFSPLREALGRLTAEGLVVEEAQRGYAVADISVSDLKDIVNVRVLVEREALRQAIRTGDAEWEAGILAAFRRLEQVERDDGTGILPPQWPALHRRFHDALTAACDSAILKETRVRLFDRAHRYRTLSTLTPDHVREKSGEHRAIMEAVLRRDSRLALKLTERHLRDTAKLALAALDRQRRGAEAAIR